MRSGWWGAMTNSPKSNPWWKKHLTEIVIGVIIGLTVEWLKGFPISRFIGRAATWIWEQAVRPVTLPAGVLALIVLLAAVLVMLLLVVFWRNGEPIKWTHYQKDTFLGVRWQWSYYSDGTISPSSITPICPRCQFQLAAKAGDYPYREVKFSCANCHFFHEVDGIGEDVQHHVGLLVQMKLRNGQWLQVVEDEEDVPPTGVVG
jgi:hypothetical protein